MTNEEKLAQACKIKAESTAVLDGYMYSNAYGLTVEQQAKKYEAMAKLQAEIQAAEIAIAQLQRAMATERAKELT